jgi:hypothetical protein
MNWLGSLASFWLAVALWFSGYISYTNAETGDDWKGSEILFFSLLWPFVFWGIFWAWMGRRTKNRRLAQ